MYDTAYIEQTSGQIEKRRTVMNRAQKMAWMFLVTTSLALSLSGAGVAVLYFIIGMPKALAGLGFMGIAGLGGLAPAIFRKERGKVDFDERDAAIHAKAAMAGFVTAFLLTGLACMLPFFILGPHAVIQVKLLPMTFMVAGISHYLVWSLVTLGQYSWRDKENE
jgi:uncharacterized membrane protein YccF (DUF307 family)